MASCEGEAQKARRPVVLSINKLAKGSSHHRSRPIRNGPSNKNRRDPAFETFPSTHRPYSALPPPPPPPLLRFFESSPLWLVAAQPTRPIRIILRRFTEPPSLSIDFFFFLSLFLTRAPSRGFPPVPSLDLSTQNLCLRTTLTLERREIGNCRFTQSLREEPACSKGDAVSFLSSFMEEACCCAKVSDWKFKIALVGSGVVSGEGGDRSCKI